jgi:hypothetical protein
MFTKIAKNTKNYYIGPLRRHVPTRSLERYLLCMCICIFQLAISMHAGMLLIFSLQQPPWKYLQMYENVQILQFLMTIFLESWTLVLLLVLVEHSVQQYMVLRLLVLSCFV